MAACKVPGRVPRSSMKRPRPVSSAASSTRSIERPTHGRLASSMPDIDAAAACAILTYSPGAFFSAPRRNYCQNIRRASHAAGSHDLPIRLILRESFAPQHQLASRETFRNSRGLTPAWSRKNRVKWAGSGNPNRSLISPTAMS